MTHASLDARTPRPAADYRWTDNKAIAFLQALAQHGKVAAAARTVGMTRQSAYRLKQRVPQIAGAWARAQAIGRARRLAGPRKSVTLRSPRRHFGFGKVTVSAAEPSLSPSKATLFGAKVTVSGRFLP